MTIEGRILDVIVVVVVCGDGVRRMGVVVVIIWVDVEMGSIRCL